MKKAINNLPSWSAERVIKELGDELINSLPIELKPLDGQQKSFYGKAQVVLDQFEATATLYSYGTKILVFRMDKQEFRRCWSGWSATTAQHIKAFCGKYIAKSDWTDLGNGLPVFTVADLNNPRGLAVARRTL